MYFYCVIVSYFYFRQIQFIVLNLWNVPYTIYKQNRWIRNYSNNIKNI